MRILIRRPGEINLAPDMHVDSLCSAKVAGVACGGKILYDSMTQHVYEVTENGEHHLPPGSLVELNTDKGLIRNAMVTGITINYAVEQLDNGASLVDIVTQYKMVEPNG